MARVNKQKLDVVIRFQFFKGDEPANTSKAPTSHEATPPLVVSKQHTTIHLVDGEKGGAGKSFVSKALIEYCSSINHSVMVVDADNSNQDISRIYRGVQSAYEER